MSLAFRKDIIAGQTCKGLKMTNELDIFIGVATKKQLEAKASELGYATSWRVGCGLFICKALGELGFRIVETKTPEDFPGHIVINRGKYTLIAVPFIVQQKEEKEASIKQYERLLDEGRARVVDGVITPIGEQIIFDVGFVQGEGIPAWLVIRTPCQWVKSRKPRTDMDLGEWLGD